MSFTTASPALSRPSKRNTMSVTQTYFLAHKARAKLSREAAQPDHDLRLLVGHANLLDSLMLELADAERDQERWFNQSVRGAAKPKPKPSNLHIQWADQVMEDAVDEEEYDSCASDSDSDDSDYDEDDDITSSTSSITTAPPPVTTPQIVITHEDGDEDDVEEEDDLEEDYAQLELVRTHSHSSTPPELVDHDSESSDDEALPPSPADAELPLLDKDVEVSEQEDSLFEQEDFYKPSPASLAPAIPVY